MWLEMAFCGILVKRGVLQKGNGGGGCKTEMIPKWHQNDTKTHQNEHQNIF